MLNKSLEIARGLAALWVFLYHMRFNLDPGLFRRFADCGLLGVPAFFVISGYCMMASSRDTVRKGRTAGSFLHRRLRRIFPPFWASIAVCLAAPFLGAAVGWYRGGHWMPSPPWYKFSVVDWLGMATLTKGLATTGPTHTPWAPVNSVYWSRAIEVQFYLVMALAVVLRRGFGVLLAVVAIGGVAAPLLQSTIHPYLTATRDLRLLALDAKLAPPLAQFRVLLRMIAYALQRATGCQISYRKIATESTDETHRQLELFKETAGTTALVYLSAFQGRLAASVAWRIFPSTVRILIRIAELVVVSCVVELAMALPMALYFHRITVFALPVMSSSCRCWPC